MTFYLLRDPRTPVPRQPHLKLRASPVDPTEADTDELLPPGEVVHHPVQGAESDVQHAEIQRVRALFKPFEPLPALDYLGNPVRTNWGRMTSTPPFEPAMQNIPIRPEPPGGPLRVSEHFRAPLPPLQYTFNDMQPPKDPRPLDEQLRECVGLAKEPNEGNAPKRVQAADPADPDASGAGSWAAGCFPDGRDEEQK